MEVMLCRHWTLSSLQGQRSVISSGGGLSAEGAKHIGGSGGMLPRKSLKSRVSEMPFPAHWGQNLQTSNGQKTTYKMWKFTCSLDRIIFQNVITGAVFVVNTLCNCFLIILTTPTLHEKAAKHKPYNASVLTSWYILFKYFNECTVHNNLNLLKLIQRKSGGGL